jgi:hypothetical protein
MAEVAHIFGQLLSAVKVMYSFRQKTYWVTYILGDFFTTSSGHPARRPQVTPLQPRQRDQNRKYDFHFSSVSLILT